MKDRQFKELTREETNKYYELVQQDPHVCAMYKLGEIENYSNEQLLLHTIIELVKLKEIYIEECIKLQNNVPQVFILPRNTEII